jgi:hypothetical protein
MNLAQPAVGAGFWVLPAGEGRRKDEDEERSFPATSASPAGFSA